MADNNDKTLRVRTGMAIGAGLMGVVTASIGVVAPPAFGDDYPSWNDVQQAKANQANQQAMVDNITKLISDLQSSVDAARICDVFAVSAASLACLSRSAAFCVALSRATCACR